MLNPVSIVQVIDLKSYVQLYIGECYLMSSKKISVHRCPLRNENNLLTLHCDVTTGVHLLCWPLVDTSHNNRTTIEFKFVKYMELEKLIDIYLHTCNQLKCYLYI